MKKILAMSLFLTVTFAVSSSFAQIENNELSCEIYDLATAQQLAITGTVFEWPLIALGMQVRYEPLALYGNFTISEIGNNIYKYSIEFGQEGGESGELTAKLNLANDHDRVIELGAGRFELAGMGDMIQVGCRITQVN